MSTKRNNSNDPYPAVNLRDPAVVKTQLDNVSSFRPKWRNLMIPSAIICSLPIWNQIIPPERVDGGYFVMGGFVLVGYLLYRMFRYTCPHCGERPMSVSISADGSSFTYTKGVALFPKRCVKCGYYLSEFALMEDIEIQQMQSDRSSSLHSD
jgi:hypothetical protein